MYNFLLQVGDPFKDTSGPALNVLIKTMTMMALMLAPAYANMGPSECCSSCCTRFTDLPMMCS
jgi:hypothetical protein